MILILVSMWTEITYTIDKPNELSFCKNLLIRK